MKPRDWVFGVALAVYLGCGILGILAQQPIPCTPYGEPRCTRTPTPSGQPPTATPIPLTPTPRPPTPVPSGTPPGPGPTPPTPPTPTNATVNPVEARITVQKQVPGTYRYDGTQLVNREGVPVVLCFAFTDGSTLPCSGPVRKP